MVMKWDIMRVPCLAASESLTSCWCGTRCDETAWRTSNVRLLTCCSVMGQYMMKPPDRRKDIQCHSLPVSHEMRHDETDCLEKECYSHAVACVRNDETYKKCSVTHKLWIMGQDLMRLCLQKINGIIHILGVIKWKFSAKSKFKLLTLYLIWVWNSGLKIMHNVVLTS